MNNKVGSARMRPRARLISLLGDELISDERVAVVELVKNAYDADATQVDVTFEINDKNIPIRLIITDDGHGMDLDSIVHGWFEPGTVMKKKDDRSPGGRLYQGAKGVGRFAAARLGESMFLETKKLEAVEGSTVMLEWGLFDDESYLDQIEMSYELSKLNNIESGTVITIEGLSDKKIWEEDDFKNLQYRLSRLISPFNEINDFKINLVIPNFPEISGEVEPHPLTRQPKYKFAGKLDYDGSINAKLEIEDQPTKEYSNVAIGKKGKFVECGPFEFEIRAWDRDKDGMSPFMLKYDMNLSTVRKKLDDYCGVSIYRDGFRVHPYGELGDDWLTLDNRSRQNPTHRLAKNQVIASIKTSRNSNPELKDRTTREGLVHTEEFEELKAWFLEVLSILEGERYKLRPREDAKPEYIHTLFEAFDISTVVNEAKLELGQKHKITKLITQKDTEIREGVKKLQEHYSRVLMLAGLGQLVDLVIHEIGAPLGRINREFTFLEKIMNKYDLEQKDQDNLKDSLKNMTGWLDQIGNLRSRLDPKTAGKRGRATSFDVADEILGNLNLYQNLISKQQININFIQPKKPIIVHMSRSVLGQVIANLLDNSIFWLTRHHGDGKGGEIEIELKASGHGFTVKMSDDGPGIPENDRERIFEQYFSSKPNGMGLGLYIIRQIIEPYGRFILNDESSLSGASFQANFSQKVGL